MQRNDIMEQYKKMVELNLKEKEIFKKENNEYYKEMCEAFYKEKNEFVLEFMKMVNSNQFYKKDMKSIIYIESNENHIENDYILVSLPKELYPNGYDDVWNIKKEYDSVFDISPIKIADMDKKVLYDFVKNHIDVTEAYEDDEKWSFGSPIIDAEKGTYEIIKDFNAEKWKYIVPENELKVIDETVKRRVEEKKQNKAILDKKIQQNNIDLQNYTYSEHDEAYKRIEAGRYDGIMYEIVLDKKGYLTERYYGEGPGDCDTDFVTVYDDDGNKFHFTTMDDCYEYECKNGKLYYVGYFDDDVYGMAYLPEKENEEGFPISGSSEIAKVLYEDKDMNFFEDKKMEILSNYIEMHEKTNVAQMQKKERNVSDLTVEQKEATQNFLASKFGTKKNIVSAYEQAQQMLNDILPQDYEQYDGPEME